ncbi:D-amino acid dehydrogenase small subunit [Fimbriiglobus ruber]|uniref:D-amino acid dehydrogenase small subunit n=1 Tax=Fimbriiglobus ruber TaxID=1908690 RepID=A0A225E342_9BACT|nr:D-amino acid dehydrogenase small subunit [Fimbriiglobus ruber]
MVVGGGVVGAACAYYLAKAGRTVTVLDRAGFGAGCSHANCGYVCPSHVLPLAGPGAIWSTLKTMFSRNSPLKVRLGVVLRNPGWFLGFARRCTDRRMMSAGGAIHGLLTSSRRLYDDLIRGEQVECEWETKGLLFVYRSQQAMDHYAATDRLLRERFDTPARRLDGDSLTALEPSLKPGLAGGWLYEGDAHLRPDRLMGEFRRVLTGLGVEIREHSPVAGFLYSGGRAAGVRTATGDVPADDVVVATGAWTPKFARELGCRIPIQPGKGYSVTFPRSTTGPAYPMIFEEDRVAVTPFRSGFRIGSTMEFAGYDERLNRGRLALLTAAAGEYLRDPAFGPATDEWWGWRPMTPDGVPVIGPSPALPNVWLAAGHNMLGLSMAPATGKLVAEMITGSRPHLDPSPYAATRF